MTLDAIVSSITPSFMPDGGLPDADTFFDILRTHDPDFLSGSEGQYVHRETYIHWWMVSGSMYVIVPEYDFCRRYDGQDATEERAMSTLHNLYRTWYNN